MSCGGPQSCIGRTNNPAPTGDRGGFMVEDQVSTRAVLVGQTILPPLRIGAALLKGQSGQCCVNIIKERALGKAVNIGPSLTRAPHPYQDMVH